MVFSLKHKIVFFLYAELSKQKGNFRTFINLKITDLTKKITNKVAEQLKKHLQQILSLDKSKNEMEFLKLRAVVS